MWFTACEESITSLAPAAANGFRAGQSRIGLTASVNVSKR